MSHYISHEDDVKAYPNNTFMAFFEQHLSQGVWKHASGLDSFYGVVIHPNAKKCIFISQGRSESVVKYAEFIYELYQNGFSVCIFDHEGQGQSSRLLSNPHIGYVKHFDDYVDNMHTLITKVFNPLLDTHQQGHISKVLLCHSMGGAIGTLYVQAYPTMFTQLVLSAPMLGVASPISESFTQFIVRTVLTVRKLCGLPVRYFWGQGNYEAYPFDKNRLTNCEARYRVYREMMADYPQNQLGGISFDWLHQAIQGMRQARANGHIIAIPVLVFEAEQEQIVDNKEIGQFVNTLPNGQLIIVRGAKHELLFEQDSVRTPVLDAILTFLAQS